MDFKKIEKQLELQGRKKGWLIKNLESYPMEYYRIEKKRKEIPLSWFVKIPQLLCVELTILN
mgnify:FL=1|tara:strand:+ start:266 stop:451 length:186 start_codon:yes stop_codon:yes gene_type:complete